MSETTYVVGFAFNTTRSHFVAIDKLRGPKDVVGRLNGVGGKVEPDENLHDAMVREFQEETGVATTRKQWQHFADLRGPGFLVMALKTVLTPAQLGTCRTVEEEIITLLSVDPLHPRTVRNLKFLVPLALTDDPKLGCVVVNYLLA